MPSNIRFLGQILAGRESPGYLREDVTSTVISVPPGRVMDQERSTSLARRKKIVCGFHSFDSSKERTHEKTQSSSMEALYEIYYGLFQPNFIKTTPVAFRPLNLNPVTCPLSPNWS